MNVRDVSIERTVVSNGYTNSLNVSGGPARLMRLRVYSKAASARAYIQVFDAETPPTDWTIKPSGIIPVDPDSLGGDQMGAGMRFTNGMQVIMSSSNTSIVATAEDFYIGADLGSGH